MGTCIIQGCDSQMLRRYHLQADFDVMQCRGCGMMYRQPFPSEAQTQQMYDDDRYVSSIYFTRQQNTGGLSPEVPIYRQGLEWLNGRVRHQGADRTLLDVGCGPGLFLSLAREQGWKVEGVELSRKQAERATQEFGVDVACADFVTADLARQRYDVITMWDFLEHVPKPEAVLDRARSLLAPGGYLLVFTIDCSSLFNSVADVVYRTTFGHVSWLAAAIYDTHHNFYFTESSLTYLIERNGFRIESRGRHRAHLERWTRVHIPWWIRVGAEAIDLLSVLTNRQYRQLVFCRPA